VCGKSVTVSADTVKPVYILNEADFKNTVCNPGAKETPAVIAPPAKPPLPPAIQTTHSGRYVCFPERFNI
jgi:hypothetical protein